MKGIKNSFIIIAIDFILDGRNEGFLDGRFFVIKGVKIKKKLCRGKMKVLKIYCLMCFDMIKRYCIFDMYLMKVVIRVIINNNEQVGK